MTALFHPMDPEIKARWIAALRSGRYVRVKGCMRKDVDGKACFCVFGVLLEELGIGAWDCNDDETRISGREVVTYLHQLDDGTMSRELPPESVRASWLLCELAVNRLTAMNDVGASFVQMARWIEAHL